MMSVRSPIAVAICSGRIENGPITAFQGRHWSSVKEQKFILCRNKLILDTVLCTQRSGTTARCTYGLAFSEPFSWRRNKDIVEFNSVSRDTFGWSKILRHCRGARDQVRNNSKDGCGETLTKELGQQWEVPKSAVRELPDSEGFQRFYATCEMGFEQILAAELSSPLIGALQVEAGSGGVAFVGTQSTGYNAILWLRTGVRVLNELARGPLPKSNYGVDCVYEFVRVAANWPSLLVDDSAPETSMSLSHRFDSYLQSDRRKTTNIGSSWEVSEMDKGPRKSLSQRGICTSRRYSFRNFAVQSEVFSCTGIDNSTAASTSADKAICDALRDACDSCSPELPEKREAFVEVPLFLSLSRDCAILYRDLSGVSLQKRGYRDVRDRPDLNAGVAAAVLTIAGWNQTLPGFGEANKNMLIEERVLLDPFCGTGSFLIEAALMASNVAPGLMRWHWPFQAWHDFDEELWTRCRDTAVSLKVPSPSGVQIVGNNVNEGAVAKCKRDAKAAGVLHLLEVSCTTSRHYEPPSRPLLSSPILQVLHNSHIPVSEEKMSDSIPCGIDSASF